ncbi:hypothetical protein HKBW3S09_01923, partial [Candidatus Hakubella thermalkaliphila]
LILCFIRLCKPICLCGVEGTLGEIKEGLNSRFLTEGKDILEEGTDRVEKVREREIWFFSDA